MTPDGLVIATGILMLAATLILLPVCKRRPPPVAPPAPEEFRSTGMLWDTKSAKVALALPEVPEPPLPTANDFQERAARSAEIARREGREAALADAERQALLSPDKSSAQHHAGLLALGLGQRDKARSYFQAAVKIDPNAAGSLFNLAQLDLRDGRYAEALESYRRLTGLNIDQALPYYRLLLCQALTGETAVLDEEKLPAGSLAGYYARAVLAAQRGDQEEAWELVRKAREIFPGQTRTYDADMKLLGSIKPKPPEPVASPE